MSVHLTNFSRNIAFPLVFGSLQQHKWVPTRWTVSRKITGSQVCAMTPAQVVGTVHRGKTRIPRERERGKRGRTSVRERQDLFRKKETQRSTKRRLRYLGKGIPETEKVFPLYFCESIRKTKVGLCAEGLRYSHLGYRTNLPFFLVPFYISLPFIGVSSYRVL